LLCDGLGSRFLRQSRPSVQRYNSAASSPAKGITVRRFRRAKASTIIFKIHILKAKRKTPMSKLIIRTRRIHDVTVLDLDGKLKLGEGNSELHDEIRKQTEKGEKNILLNMENVFSIDSSGLGTLVAGFYTVRKNGGRIKLLHLAKRVHELMFITRLLTVFDVYEDESEAIKSFKIPAEKRQRQFAPERGLL
jgi:anti-sigma B factor antagonist